MEETLRELVEMALRADLGDKGDVTSTATIPEDQIIHGRITAKADGVIAGLAAVQMVYAQIDPSVEVTLQVKDGDTVAPGTVVCEVRGSGRSVLSGERAALNFLQRLSGVATLTNRFVQAVNGTEATILDTRKTTPGWRELEKYAVRMGGGQNHRLGLYDEVLIKDNHIDAAGGIAQAVNAVRATLLATGLPIVVEVKDEAELRETLPLDVTRILLDNMTLEQLRQAGAITAGRTPLEASGNVNLQTVGDIARTGVNYISVGALTHSAPALDLSMRLVTEKETI